MTSGWGRALASNTIDASRRIQVSCGAPRLVTIGGMSNKPAVGRRSAAAAADRPFGSAPPARRRNREQRAHRRRDHGDDERRDDRLLDRRRRRPAAAAAPRLFVVGVEVRGGMERSSPTFQNGFTKS